MNHLFTLVLLFSSGLLWGQSLEIEDAFYPKKLPEMTSWRAIESYWEGEIKQIESQMKYRKPTPELLYRMVIARHNIGDENLLELIEIMDNAITLNPDNPKYFAVRGILKFNWGAYSESFGIESACPDIQKAIGMDLPIELQKSSSIRRIQSHRACDHR